MRIHTNLCRGMIDIAAKEAGVNFERCTLHGSRSRDHAFDVILSGDSGRRANFGGDWEAASWDQWGIFLGRIFKDDPDAVCWAYKDADDFHWQTGDRFLTLTLKDATRFHKWGLGEYDGYGSTSRCKHDGCAAIRRWKV
jgi:hypothetical protein